MSGTKTSLCGKKKERKLGSQLMCPFFKLLFHSLTHFPYQLSPFCTEETCKWSVVFNNTWRRCWHTHGWISSCQLPPQLSSCCCSGPPPYAALSMCRDFPLTPVLGIPVSPPASTASQGIPLLHCNRGLSCQCYLPLLPFRFSVFSQRV